MAEQIYVPIYQKNDNILLNPNRSIPENGIVFCFPTQSFYCHPAYILVNGVQMNSVINYEPTGLNQPYNLYYTTLTVQEINDLANEGTGQAGPQGPQGIQGVQGTQGIQGEQGVQGETGAALTVLGSYPNLAAFEAGAGGSPGEAGQAWLIESDGSLYIWNTATSAWEDVGDLQGPPGVQGIQGIQGEQGIQGIQGIQGVSGTSGISGTAGTSGTSYNPPFSPVYGLFSQTGDSTPITNTTVETTIINGGVGTLSVPANGFSIGDAFRADFGGLISTGNNQTIRIRLKTGSVILADSGVQTINNVSNNVWSLSVNFTIRALGGAGTASIVALGTFNYAKTVNGTVEGFSFNTVNNTTFNTTINNTLDVTVQWGAASTLNTIYSDIFVLNKIY